MLDTPGISEKQRDKYPYNNWKLRIGAIEIGLETGNPFPDEHGFYDSIWFLWKDRIENGRNEEEKQIQSTYKKWKDQIGHSDDPSFDPDGWAGDDYWQTCRVTNSMYAALVVSVWSEMECFLKSMVSICSDALGGKEKKTKEPYKLNEIKKALRAYGIELEKCSKYTAVDAIRILNNSYKHSDGHYRPKAGKPHTQIDQYLLSKWKILKDQNEDEIDYSKLPIQQIVVDCNSFCTDLLERIKAVLAPY